MDENDKRDQIRWVLNEGGTPSIQQGILAARPFAGEEGRLFLDIEGQTIYRDTGTEWVVFIASTPV